MAGRSINKVILIGNLTADPDLRTTQTGRSVCTLRLATNERYKTADGEWVDRAEFHRIVLWGRTAEVADEFLGKGEQVYLEGKLQTREWQDRDGNRRWTTEIVGRELVMLGGRGAGRSGSRGYTPRAETGNERGQPNGTFAQPSSSYEQKPREPKTWEPKPQSTNVQPSESDDLDDDLPF